MVEPVSFKGTFFTNLIKNNKAYTEKISETYTYVNGIKYSKKVNWLKVYENPNAEAILKQIKEIKQPQKERNKYLRLKNELGPYKIIDLDFEKKTQKLYRQLDRDIIMLKISEKIDKFFNLFKKK